VLGEDTLVAACMKYEAVSLMMIRPSNYLEAETEGVVMSITASVPHTRQAPSLDSRVYHKALPVIGWVPAALEFESV
jgi:hypothetical protein